MIISYNNCFWGDSTIERIEIAHDRIAITVFNDVMQKDVVIVCSNCAGLTQMITWDENIIENIYLEKIIDNQHQLLREVSKMYGSELGIYQKNLNMNFWELRVVLINGHSFSIICEEVQFTTE